MDFLGSKFVYVNIDIGGSIGQCRLKSERTAQQQPDGDTVRLLIYLVHKIINR